MFVWQQVCVAVAGLASLKNVKPAPVEAGRALDLRSMRRIEIYGCIA